MREHRVGAGRARQPVDNCRTLAPSPFTVHHEALLSARSGTRKPRVRANVRPRTRAVHSARCCCRGHDQLAVRAPECECAEMLVGTSGSTYVLIILVLALINTNLPILEHLRRAKCGQHVNAVQPWVDTNNHLGLQLRVRFRVHKVVHSGLIISSGRPRGQRVATGQPVHMHARQH